MRLITLARPEAKHVQTIYYRQALDAHGASNFVLLLANNKLLTFKGLYACDGNRDTAAERVFGLGPVQLDISMVSDYRANILEYCRYISIHFDSSQEI